MSLTSLEFIIFAFAVILLYYLLPKKMQWIVLLCASVVFYCFSGIQNIIYIVATAGTTYAATRIMESLSVRQENEIKAFEGITFADKKKIKARIKLKRKRVMIITLIFNIGVLCFFKYTGFILNQVDGIASLFKLHLVNIDLKLMIPLGISFYTFQTIGYLVNVYWEKTQPEKNFFKLLLFVMYFPQLTQGPISEYNQLGNQLLAEHTFKYVNYSRGAQRMLWGYFKKMVVANMSAPIVNSVFENYSSYSGISVFIGMVFYSVQIYADFSGYMDIVCGFSEILGIELTENFERPYFSKSVAEYWRRWHISLGAWFKAYVYYPIAISGWNRNIGKKAKKKFGNDIGKNVSASLALVIVWLTTGLWHGASWAYIAWGGLNGLFIIVSMWLKPIYAKSKSLLKIKEESFSWRAFQVIRSFVLITFIKVLPEVGTLKQGLGLWKQVFAGAFMPIGSLSNLIPGGLSKVELLILLSGICIIFITSMIQRKQSIRMWFSKYPIVIKVIAVVVIFFAIVLIGIPMSENNGGFMYAQF